MPRKPRPGKYEEIPLFHPDTGRKYDRRKFRYNEKTREMERFYQNPRLAPPPLPDCPLCIKAEKTRPNKVRVDAFGRALGECNECLAAPGGRADKGLLEMGRIVTPGEDSSR